jgi:CRP/FNR family transcriptional regulator
MRQLIAHLKSIGTLTLYRRGATLYRQGEIPREACIILSGVVKAYTINQEGDQTIVNLCGKGTLIPLAWIHDESEKTLFHYEAVNDVRVLSIRKSDFHAAIAKSPELQMEYIHYLIRAQISLLLRVTGLSQPRAITKICYTLSFLMVRYGIEKKPGVYEIDLKLTQTMLANLIGQTRESTAKNLKFLKEAGAITYKNSTYRINREKLDSFIGKDEAVDLSSTLV